MSVTEDMLSNYGGFDQNSLNNTQLAPFEYCALIDIDNLSLCNCLVIYQTMVRNKNHVSSHFDPLVSISDIFI